MPDLAINGNSTGYEMTLTAQDVNTLKKKTSFPLELVGLFSVGFRSETSCEHQSH